MSLLLWTTLSIFIVLAESCQDMSRDCLFRKELCNSSVNAERALVQAACPYTCHVCSRKDAKHPTRCRDAVPDCYERRELCSEPSYQRMMRRQCAHTCGFCIPDGDVLPPPVISSSSLEESNEDFAARRRFILRKLEKSGVTAEELRALIRQQIVTTTIVPVGTVDTVCLDRAVDCSEKIGLCSHRTYNSLVNKMCRRTCNLC